MSNSAQHYRGQGEPCFEPGPPLEGALTVPGSKSIAQRALLAACFGRRESRIVGARGPADVEAAVRMCSVLGAGVEVDPAGDAVTIRPGAGTPGGPLECGESGTGARLALGLAALATPEGTEFELRPTGTLKQRSSGRLLSTLKRAGLEPHSTGSGSLEFGFKSLGPQERRLQLREPSSSQEVSALLMGLAAGGGGRLEVRGGIPSEPYVHLTRSTLKRLGIAIGFEHGRASRTVFKVPDGGVKGGPFHVDPDASSGAVGLMALSLSHGSGHVVGFTRRSGQADAQVADCLAKMGASIQVDQGPIQVSGRPENGARLDFSDCPDLAPVVAAAAGAVALRVPGDAGRTTLTGLQTLPGKESSRIEVLGHGLRALGLQVHWDERSLDVRQGSTPPHAEPVVLDGCNDHRMVFAFALLSLVRPGIQVLGTSAVGKSWPSFFEALEALGAVRPSN